MKMEVFTDKLYKEVAAKFGGGIQAEAREIRKNNGVILHGLLVKRQGRNVAATIYLDRLLEAYESGISFQAIARKVLDICQEEWDRDSAMGCPVPEGRAVCLCGIMAAWAGCLIPAD